jgi:hypothetical protein
MCRLIDLDGPAGREYGVAGERAKLDAAQQLDEELLP